MSVTVLNGSRIESRNYNEHSAPQELLKGRPIASDFEYFRNLSSSWRNKKGAVSLNGLPKKRQTQSPDVDDTSEDFLDTLNDATEEADVGSKEEDPSSRQDILEPNVINALRLPHPYPFQPVPVRIFPNELHVHHYKGVPVPVPVEKYKHIAEPYYVPYKPKPDYTVMHVHVYDPGNYVNLCHNNHISSLALGNVK